jgi:ABC-2 type transport system permease protein
MAYSDMLQTADGSRTWRGFGPLLGKENRAWWGTRRWLVQAVLWLVVVNGLLAMVLFALPRIMPADQAPANTTELVQNGLQAFFGAGGMALAIGVIVLAQDTVIGEKQAGTAEWVLSKPVSRFAFWLSKLAAHAIGALIILILLQGLVAYLQLSLFERLELLAFLGGLGILALHTLFYLVLTLLMGVLTDSRGLVLAVSLGTLLGGSLLVSFEPLLYVTPWGLSNVAVAAAAGLALPAKLLLPIAVTAGWCLLFAALALWRIRRIEF